jgi:diacylglycerol kinase family enzyme
MTSCHLSSAYSAESWSCATVGIATDSIGFDLNLRQPMARMPAEPLDPQARSLLISVSPRAGSRSTERRALGVAAELEAAGYQVQVTNNLDELSELAADWHEAGRLRCVLACGGDGTAAIVRNRTPLDTPLLLVPMGTENLLGQYVAQSAAPAAVRETVDRGVAIRFDLGQYRHEETGSEVSGSRYFLTMISAGFDAEVVRRLHRRRRGNITRLSYVQPTLETIRSYEYPELQLYCHDDSRRPVEPVCCRWVFGFNLPLYARGWQVAPDADGTDGLLDVCMFHRGSLVHVARYLWHVMRKSHFQLADARLTRGRSLRVEATGPADVAFQVDGDYGGTLPVEVEVLPGMLRMLVLPDVARRLGFAW